VNSKFVYGFIINASWSGTTMTCIVFPKNMKTMIIFYQNRFNTINHSHKHENARKNKIHKHVLKWSLIHKNIQELSHEILHFLQLVRKWYMCVCVCAKTMFLFCAIFHNLARKERKVWEVQRVFCEKVGPSCHTMRENNLKLPHYKRNLNFFLFTL